MKKYIMVVEASFLGVAFIARAIRNLGYEPVFLTNYWNQEGDALIQLAQEKAVFCKTTEIEDIKRVVNAFGIEKIAGLTTLLDSRLAIIATANKELGLPGVSASVLNLKDKAWVNNIIPEYIPASLAIEFQVTPEKTIEDFITASGAEKYIAKPGLTAGAIGAFTFCNYAEFKEKISLAIEKIPDYLNPNQYVIQEFFDGELVSIEGYVCQDNVDFIGATKRFKYGNTEVQHQFPYQDEMGDLAYSRCKNVINTLIDRADFTYGFFHIEFIVNGDEVRLIDANMGRPGGTNVMELIAFAYDISPVKIFEHAISVAVFQKPVIENSFFDSPVRQDVTGILYGLAESARILRFDLPDPASSHHLAVNMGTIIPALGESNWSGIGTLTGKYEDVFSDLAKIKMTTDKGEYGAVITQ